jgi:DNA topoisomerase-1
MKLFLVESPAKCKKIAGFLGPGWRVQASMGHIRALEEDIDAVGIDRDFEPRYAFIKTKAKAIASIKDAAKGCSEVYLGADDDREGEAIAFSCAVLLGLDPATTPRVIFHEITEKAIKDAVASPRLLDMNRVNAQQARAVLDMLVGFTISPLLWKYVGPALSAGRCQTAALRLLVDRENEIGAFTSARVWRISGDWYVSEIQTAGAGAVKLEAALDDELEDEESALNFLENIHADGDALVRKVSLHAGTESPPKPLITSTLQQESSAMFGSNPKRTMQIAQRLYEAGHITYMRTDSAVLCEEARVQAQEIVKKDYGEAYLGGALAPPAKKKKAAAGAQAKPQEAHEAIRPTHFELVELSAEEDWSAADRKIYRLIRQRALQSVMAAARTEERRINFVATGDPAEFGWTASTKRSVFAGWKIVGAPAVDLDAVAEGGGAAAAGGTTETNATWDAYATVKEGATLTWTRLQAAPHDSRAAGRFTEATLVRELERRGIGRPSTFASLVETVVEKTYAEKKDIPARSVELTTHTLATPGQWPATPTVTTRAMGGEKGKLVPTPLGHRVHDFCVKEFAALFQYEFTSQMEGRLDGIAGGTEPWKQVCRDTWGSYKERWSALKAATGVAADSARKREFADGLKAVMSKKGPLLLREHVSQANHAQDPGFVPNSGHEGADKKDTVFYGWPEGVKFESLTAEAAAAFVAVAMAAKAAQAAGELEGDPIYRKSGPYGAYIEWRGARVPVVEGESAEATAERLKAKAGAGGGVVVGDFEFRTGQYGMYMFKKDSVGKARKFVGVPSGIKPSDLTAAAAIKIYQTGLQNKAKAAAFKNKGKA